eukprot:116445-Prymnesium_polylepis.1
MGLNPACRPAPTASFSSSAVGTAAVGTATVGIAHGFQIDRPTHPPAQALGVHAKELKVSRKELEMIIAHTNGQTGWPTPG